jgi:hypothetical protein
MSLIGRVFVDPNAGFGHPLRKFVDPSDAESYFTRLRFFGRDPFIVFATPFSCPRRNVYGSFPVGISSTYLLTESPDGRKQL